MFCGIAEYNIFRYRPVAQLPEFTLDVSNWYVSSNAHAINITITHDVSALLALANIAVSSLADTEGRKPNRFYPCHVISSYLSNYNYDYLRSRTTKKRS